MGSITVQDTALSIQILMEILVQYEVEFSLTSMPGGRRRDIVMIASYLVMGFCCGLRGNEPFLMEATAVCENINKGKLHEDSYVCLPLMGRFKNEDGERNVIWFVVGKTASGIPVRRWIERLVGVLRSEGKDRGIWDQLSVFRVGMLLPIGIWMASSIKLSSRSRRDIQS